MTSVRKLLAVAAAVAMVGTPVMAAAAPASQLSVVQAQKARAGTRTAKASELRGGSIVLTLVAAAAVIGGIALAASGGGSTPRSP